MQQRRTLPMRVIQAVQIFIQNKLISRVLASETRPKPPLAAKLLEWFPYLRRFPAWLVGVGIHHERVRTPQVGA